MAFCIERFSSYLCLIYSTDLCAYETEFDLFDKNQLVIFILMMKLHDIFEKEIQSTVDAIFNCEKIFSSHFFLRTILSRCVKLSENPTYIHFMLACTLVKQVIRANFCSTKCFTFPKIASLALVAVYNRCYKEFFDSRYQYKTLECYCEHLNSILATESSSKARRVMISFVIPQINLLMASLNNVDHNNFQLTDDEQVQLNDIFLNACPEDLTEDGDESARRPSESETDSDDTIEYSILNNNPYIKNRCEFCGFDCSKFILDLCDKHESLPDIKNEF